MIYSYSFYNSKYNLVIEKWNKCEPVFDLLALNTQYFKNVNSLSSHMNNNKSHPTTNHMLKVLSSIKLQKCIKWLIFCFCTNTNLCVNWILAKWVAFLFELDTCVLCFKYFKEIVNSFYFYSEFICYFYKEFLLNILFITAE